jgi:hypothetical protein
MHKDYFSTKLNLPTTQKTGKKQTAAAKTENHAA